MVDENCEESCQKDYSFLGESLNPLSTLTLLLDHWVLLVEFTLASTCASPQSENITLLTFQQSESPGIWPWTPDDMHDKNDMTEIYNLEDKWQFPWDNLLKVTDQISGWCKATTKQNVAC